MLISSFSLSDPDAKLCTVILFTIAWHFPQKPLTQLLKYQLVRNFTSIKVTSNFIQISNLHKFLLEGNINLSVERLLTVKIIEVRVEYGANFEFLLKVATLYPDSLVPEMSSQGYDPLPFLLVQKPPLRLSFQRFFNSLSLFLFPYLIQERNCQ